MTVIYDASSVGVLANRKPSISGKISGMPETPILHRRINERLTAMNLSAYAASKKATKNPDAIRQIFAGHQPSAARLAAIADVLETTAEWLMGHDLPPAKVAAPRSTYNAQQLPQDVPVLGTALGADFAPDYDGMDEQSIEIHMIDSSDTIDYLRRPAAIASRRDVYGLYIAGSSMSPRFEPGDPVYVDPRRAPSIGDDVIVQLAAPDEDQGQRVSAALIKRLSRRGSDFLELEQFNPAVTFRLSIKRVASIQRVIPWREIVGA